VVLAVILTAQLMVVLDATIVNVALPHIQRSLHFSNSSLSWVLNAYVLTFGGLLLLGARSGDLLGRRRTFMAGTALFSLSSLAIFLGSQLASRVLVNRLSPKSLMLTGRTSAALGLLLATQLHASSPYAQVLASLILIGIGMGISFVSLTTAGLAGVEPSDAGAASGLINVMQQLGAAVGLAVLVTVFDTVTPSAHSADLSTAASAGPAARAALVHGIDVTMAAGAGLALLAVTTVALFVRTPARTRALEPADVELEPAAA
jgi:MFS family permease